MDWDPTRYRYEQIADDIAGQIADGRLPPRAALPSIDRLAEEYGVARMTIIRAVRVLTDRGLVVVLSGRGTFVRPPAAEQDD
ncbi:winged helix-turn-helix domain-containing protein [Actinomadura geliboluensis]|uniref:winged helix-turn-helix domain-containing protein n=1 Tax=Actinomadura geliboluensis TaxID=882440 RepID=UPI0026052199|nr:GntR family transcriptional regulator [Actinomadura geliboluensis]